MSNIDITPLPTARIIHLTPELAEQLVKRNVKNRDIKKTNYQTVLRAIRNGEWELNGEAIKIDKNGYILDGQHRIHAVIETGIAITTFLIEGLEPDTRVTMDSGKSRSIADFLKMDGEKEPFTLAAILRRVFILDHHGLRQATVASYPTTNKEVLAFFDENQWIRELSSPAKKIGARAKLPGSLTGLLMVAFSRIDDEDSEFFFERLYDGANLPAGHPILALKEVLDRVHGLKGTTTQTYLAALVIKAWNKYRAGESIKMLTYRPGGANPESFPEPR